VVEMYGGTISGNTAAFNNTAAASLDRQTAGGVRVGGTTTGTAVMAQFNMRGGSISGNHTAATVAGSAGGVLLLNNTVFRISAGTIYGSDETDEALRNTSVDGRDVYYGNPQAGTPLAASFLRGTWADTLFTSKGTIAGTDSTIKVLNGDIVP